MKNFIEKIISKIKGDKFKFDDAISSSMLYQLIINKIISIIRAQKFLLKKTVSKLIFVGRNVSISNKVIISKYTVIGDYTKIDGLGVKGVIIGRNCNIGAFCRIICSVNYRQAGDSIVIKDNVAIGEFSYVGGASKVVIGKDTIIGQYLSIHPENHIFQNKTIPIRMQGTTKKGINIGDNCWIGSKVTFTDGSSIGNRCVVGAGSVVTKKFPDNVLIVGSPAKIVKNI